MGMAGAETFNNREVESPEKSVRDAIPHEDVAWPEAAVALLWT